MPNFIEIKGISKSYGGVRALKEVSFSINAGEVHAVCGENGAGKSTLNRILCGAISADSGSIFMDGAELQLGSVQNAVKSGISIVHQESVAFLQLTCTENHQLMYEPTQLGGLWLDRLKMSQRTVLALEAIGETFAPDVPMDEMSLAQRQMVAIARAVSANSRLLILDEPTSSLSNRETKALFEVIKKMRQQGVAILYVSHRLDEIFELADTVTVLRDGTWISTKAAIETSPRELIQNMVGREVEFSPRKPAPYGEIRLAVKDLSKEGVFQDISFSIKAGEVVALAGLIGAGRSETARAIFGLDPYNSGSIILNGKRLGKKCGPAQAMELKLAFSPEDRQNEGLHLQLSVRENLMMAAKPFQSIVISNQDEKSKATSLIQSLTIKTSSDLSPVAALSGGNQQKVLLGKWLAETPEVLILDEPTRGVDVGAKDQIHRLIDDLAHQGVAILVISSELNEVIALGDRFIVMCNGRIAGELSKEEVSQEKILDLALPQSDEHLNLNQKLDSNSRANNAKSLNFSKVFAKQFHHGLSRETSVAALLILTLLFAGIYNPRFWMVSNIKDMLVNISPALIVGTMMTFVILAREIDISVGSMMGLSAAVLGIAASPDRLNLPPSIAVVLCLLSGVLGGLFNGVLVAYLNIPSIIVTLGTLTLFRGITQLILGGNWITNIPHFLRLFGTGTIFAVPNILWVALITILLGLWLSKRSRFGLQIYALGSNPSAAVLYGIKDKKLKIWLFVLAGLSASIAALMSATKLQVIENSYGTGFELAVIAAVIVGGASIKGGKGSILGSVYAVALLGIISTVLIFLKLGQSATYWDSAIEGAFILLAVMGDHLLHKRGTKA